MVATCLAPLPRLQPRHAFKSGLTNTNGHNVRTRSLVLARGKKEQKREGVYFEYQPVDPDVIDEIEALEEEEEEMFSWARRSRDKKTEVQQKQRKIDQKIFGVKTPQKRKPQPNGLRGGERQTGAKSLSEAQKREVAAQAAAATASDGPVLPSFSPVETPAMRPRAVTPEDRLSRPKTPAAAASATPVPAAKREKSAGKASVPAAVDSSDGTAGTAAPKASAEIGVGQPRAATPAGAEGTAAEPPVPKAPAGGSDRRQRLLHRMKGGAGAGSGSGGAAGSAPAAAAIATDSKVGAVGPAGSVLGAAATGATAAGAMAAATAAPPGPPADLLASDDTPKPAALPDAPSLPSANHLPPEAAPTRALLDSILNPSAQELQELTSGDVTDMLQRDAEAQAEFQQWAAQRAASATSGADATASKAASKLTEADMADLEALLAQIEDLDLGDLGLEELVAAVAVGGDGDDVAAGDDDDVRRGLAEVAELRSLMEKLDTPEESTGRDGAEGGGDMTDEQVLAALRARDPALYELLKDVPEFDKLDLDIDLDLDLESASGQLTEAEVAELAAEAAGVAGTGREGAARELEDLLRDMRGMGLIREDGTPVDAGGLDDEDEVEDDDEVNAGLGDLLEAIDDDADLDDRARMQAQYALQSMFNQPADVLAANKQVTRGSADVGKEAKEQSPSPPRGTTGMARGSVSKDDEDGGVAPPPMLPRPKPSWP